MKKIMNTHVFKVWWGLEE